MAHEHERAAGSWHAEWLPLRQLLVATGSAAWWLQDCLEHLEVRPDIMWRNLVADGGLMLAERLVGQLMPTLGRAVAMELVTSAAEDVAGGASFLDALVKRDAGRSGLPRTGFETLLDPAGYLGEAPTLVDDALRQHEEGRAG